MVSAMTDTLPTVSMSMPADKTAAALLPALRPYVRRTAAGKLLCWCPVRNIATPLSSRGQWKALLVTVAAFTTATGTPVRELPNSIATSVGRAVADQAKAFALYDGGFGSYYAPPLGPPPVTPWPADA